MKRKTLAVVLALTCLLMCCACGSNDDNVKGTVTTPAPTPEATPEPTPEPTPELTPEPTPSSADDSFDIGNVSGSTYTNSFLGIGADFDENWYLANEDELAEINGSTEEMFTDEELKEAMANSESFFDLYAARADGLATLNITIENLGILYGTVLDEESYLSLVMENMGLEKALTDMGLENIVIENVTVNVAGEARKGLAINGSFSSEGMDIPFYELLACCKVGSYMASITAATYLEDTTAELMNMFYAVD